MSIFHYGALTARVLCIGQVVIIIREAARRAHNTQITVLLARHNLRALSSRVFNFTRLVSRHNYSLVKSKPAIASSRRPGDDVDSSFCRFARVFSDSRKLRKFTEGPRAGISYHNKIERGGEYFPTSVAHECKIQSTKRDSLPFIIFSSRVSFRSPRF